MAMGMVCSSAVALLCSALLSLGSCAVSHFILLEIHFEERVGPVPEGPQDVVFLDVIFTDGKQNTIFVNPGCSSVLSNCSLSFWC